MEFISGTSERVSWLSTYCRNGLCSKRWTDSKPTSRADFMGPGPSSLAGECRASRLVLEIVIMKYDTILSVGYRGLLVVVFLVDLDIEIHKRYSLYRLRIS
jgi:hypothetical protein